MPTISKKELDDYQQLCKDRCNGRILTPDGLRLICEAYKNDPEAIGKHMLETLARIQSIKRCVFGKMKVSQKVSKMLAPQMA